MDDVAREALWEKQHEFAAQKIYSLCYDLGGLFLKVVTLSDMLLASFFPLSNQISI